MWARGFVWGMCVAGLCLAVGCDDGDDTSVGEDGAVDTSPADTAPADTGTSETTTPDTTAVDDTGLPGDTRVDDTSMADTSVDDTRVEDMSVEDMSVDDMDVSMVPPIPTDDAAALAQWLAAGHYQQWAAESAPHDSTGPHFGTVRTFVNPALEGSLAAGASEHPAGAAAVKELYGDGAEVLGYAVEVKLADTSAGGDNWYWYEGYQGSVYADGPGAGICTGCHSGGTDFVLTPYPLQ